MEILLFEVPVRNHVALAVFSHWLLAGTVTTVMKEESLLPSFVLCFPSQAAAIPWLARSTCNSLLRVDWLVPLSWHIV